ncbi:hypothetical protein MBLNU230_g7935t1 [Neophaeotheca triangularis]
MSSSNLHTLLLLSDSALPLGSFAFSSGLESFLARTKSSNTTAASRLRAFDSFLDLSLSNLASTALPYVLTAYHDPAQLETLDNDVDASTPCTVARRASVSQGRALLAIWDRALKASASDDAAGVVASEAMAAFASAVKTSKPDVFGLLRNAHFAPLFGAVCAALALSEDDAAYLFLLNHAKALLSAAVRASVMGPYQSQAVLASPKLQRQIKACIARERETKVADAAVTVPVMDLWAGRHELLYSRIFNS